MEEGPAPGRVQMLQADRTPSNISYEPNSTHPGPGQEASLTIRQSASHPLQEVHSCFRGGQSASAWPQAPPQTPQGHGLLTRLTARLGVIFPVPVPQTLFLQMGKTETQRT